MVLACISRMSRIKFLLLLAIIGMLAFIITHLSLLSAYGKHIHVINTVIFHQGNSLMDDNHVIVDLPPPDDITVHNKRTHVRNGRAHQHIKRLSLEQDISDQGISNQINLDGKVNKRASQQLGFLSSYKNSDDEFDIQLCTKQGEHLVGPLFVDQSPVKNITSIEMMLSAMYGGTVEKGGTYVPRTCTPRARVALIIPYRNRPEQLKIFLKHIHPILQRQQLFYRIIVVEQMYEDPFNRAALFNVGYAESMKMSADFDCFVFSDVDLLPEDDRNYYGCPTSPRHMSVAVDKFEYKLPYHTIFGGVGAFAKRDFERINGMSNLYWGWGGEDDDLYERIKAKGYKLTRPSLKIGRYTMIKIAHFQSSKDNPNRHNLLEQSPQRMGSDGLNSLRYNLVEVDEQPLVTFIRVKLSPSMLERDA